MLRWLQKFRCAFRGVVLSVQEEASCRIHALATVFVTALAIWLQVSALEGAVLALAIAGVWGAELLNSAIERLAKALDRNPDPQLRDALDLAAGGVLVMALAAIVVGVFILGSRCLAFLLPGAN